LVRRDVRKSRSLAAEPLGVGEAVDHMQELDDRAGPAMRQNKRNVVPVSAALMQHVDILAVDAGDDLREAVDRCLLRAPVEAVEPVIA
jgi:hypothetical protein